MSSRRLRSSEASGSSKSSRRGPRQQCPADRDALPLSARETAGAARQQSADAERLDDLIEADARCRPVSSFAGKPPAEQQVLPDREMG